MGMRGKSVVELPLISLLTDFGLLDPFVAEMKAVIFSICPEARVIDITHGVKKFDVRLGSGLIVSPITKPFKHITSTETWLARTTRS